jgi:amino acid transporter
LVGEIRNRAARLTLWAGMLAAAMVVMGSSARVLREDCSPNDDFTDGYCKRTKYALSLGVIGTFFSMAVVGMKMLTTSAPFMVEFAISIILTIMNAFGVAYITSAKGPGSAIGNLYYFAWISFLCAAFLTAECFNQFTGGNGAAPSTSTASEANRNGNTGDKDIPVEFDEQI